MPLVRLICFHAAHDFVLVLFPFLHFYQGLAQVNIEGHDLCEPQEGFSEITAKSHEVRNVTGENFARNNCYD